jgi:ParB-like chromosome segregation protein Spo0J
MNASDLKVNPRNPRKITEKRLAALGESLREYGDLSCIVHNEVSDQLVGGNQRSKVINPNAVITILKEFDPPTEQGTVAWGIIEDPDTGPMFYRRVRWDEMKERMANLKANHEGGEDDLPILAEWLVELKEMGANLEDTGVNPKTIEELLAPIKTEELSSVLESPLDAAQNLVIVQCKDEEQVSQLYEEMRERGFECKIM